MSLIGKKWVIRNEEKGTGLIDKLLLNREIDTDEKRRVFFEGDLSLVHDPMLLADMARAAERIKKAVAHGEKIMIFGDYDIDGITGVALLYDFLKKSGADVRYTLPNREEDGYGLKNYFIERFAKEGVKLLITVDCGTSNCEEIALAGKLGIDVIVTDHHSMPEKLPNAFAIINPHRPDCLYPNKAACGSTIAYKLVVALSGGLMKEAERKEYLMKQLSIVMLGIIGDCMPLTEENRLLTRYGLASLRDGHNPGMTALLENAELDPRKTNSFTIGFQAGPRLNAAGRVDKPDHALELILGNTEKAEVLNRLNALRKEVVKKYLEEAVAELEGPEEPPGIIVLSRAGWKAGLLGLIAARIAETYHRPTIAIQEREDECVGSCRSVNDFDITRFLRDAVGDLCSTIGGHKLAGGFTLPKENFEKFVLRIAKAGELAIDPDKFQGTLEIDCEAAPEDLTLEKCAQMSRLEPFGAGNPEPTLVIRNTRLLGLRPVGHDGEHLQFPVKFGGQVHSCIAFRLGEHIGKIDPDSEYDIAFNMEINEWKGNKKLQLKVVDLKLSE